MGMKGDRMGPKGGGQGVCAKPSFSTSTLNTTILSFAGAKAMCAANPAVRLFLYTVLFLMHHLVQH